MEWFSTWSLWHWLILGFVLLIAELVLPGVFLLWWGLAAIVTASIGLMIPSLSLPTLAIIYAIFALMLSVIWWKYQHGQDKKDQLRSSLNQRDHAMLGTRGMVQEIATNGIGRGHFGDTTWRIQGTDLAIGDLIEVYQVDGITLKVRKVK